MAGRVWFITGTSNGGFGEEFVKQILHNGERVIATARNVDKISHLKALGAATFALDVTQPTTEIQQIVEQAHQVFGQIDILVNCAGYCHYGTIEETNAEEVFKQFNTNVFGLLKVTQAVLPHMRERKSGVIINIGSGMGFESAPTAAFYASTKFALEAITEALRGEVKYFGIQAIVVEPGYFKTNFGQGNVDSAMKIPAYSKINSRCKLLVESMKKRGDVTKAVKIIIDVVTTSKSIPERLALGPDAYEGIKKKCERVLAQLEENKNLSYSTDL